MNQPNIIFWDLEASNLKGNIGRLLAFGYKRLGDKKASVISLADFKQYKIDPTDDFYLVKAAADILREADMLVSHYGKSRGKAGFDERFLQTRLLAHNLPVLPRIPHVDTQEIARNYLALHSNRLATFEEFLDVPPKTPIKWESWVKALAGNRKELGYIVEHCRADIEALEATYLKIRPLAERHPNIAPLFGREGMACATCGSSDLFKNGTRINGKAIKQRWACKKCGSYTLGGKAGA